MKKALSRLLSLFGGSNLTESNKSQGRPKELERFIILDAKLDGTDISEAYANGDGYLSIYTFEGDHSIYLCDVKPSRDEQTFGSIYNLQSTSFPQSETHYKTEVAAFKWAYTNSATGHQGTATLSLTRIHKPSATAFTIVIVTETMEQREYNGYVDGTLNLNL